MRIAVVDDDLEFTGFLHELLIGAGHHVVASRHGRAFLRLAKSETFDLILLDWNLTGRDGADLVRTLRHDLQGDVAIVLLTARNDANDIVTGLEAGADDYLNKPIEGRILLARIDAIMRRRNNGRHAAAVQAFGNLTFDSQQEIVRRGDRVTQLTSKEFQLAVVLFRNLSRPLSRAYLLETIWNRNPDVQTRTLDSHVARLRSKLDLRPQNGWRLAPIYSYGYRLEAVGSGAESARKQA